MLTLNESEYESSDNSCFILFFSYMNAYLTILGNVSADRELLEGRYFFNLFIFVSLAPKRAFETL